MESRTSILEQVANNSAASREVSATSAALASRAGELAARAALLSAEILSALVQTHQLLAHTKALLAPPVPSPEVLELFRLATHEDEVFVRLRTSRPEAAVASLAQARQYRARAAAKIAEEAFLAMHPMPLDVVELAEWRASA